MEETVWDNNQTEVTADFQPQTVESTAFPNISEVSAGSDGQCSSPSKNVIQPSGEGASEMDVDEGSEAQDLESEGAGSLPALAENQSNVPEGGEQSLLPPEEESGYPTTGEGKETKESHEEQNPMEIDGETKETTEELQPDNCSGEEQSGQLKDTLESDDLMATDSKQTIDHQETGNCKSITEMYEQSDYVANEEERKEESEDAEEGSYCLLPDHVDKEKMDSRDPEDSVTRDEDKSESELFASGSDKQLDSNTGMGNESTSPDNTTVCGGEPSLDIINRDYSVGTEEDDDLFSDTNAENSTNENMDESEEAATSGGLSQVGETSADPPEAVDGSMRTIITWALKEDKPCKQCKEIKKCRFRLKNPDKDISYICDQECYEALMLASNHSGRYFLRRRKFLVEETSPESANLEADKQIQRCLHCKQEKAFQFFLKQDDDTFYVCSKACFAEMSKEEPDMFKLKRYSPRMRNTSSQVSPSSSQELMKRGQVSSSAERNGSSPMLLRSAEEAEAARRDRALSFIRRCGECQEPLLPNTRSLIWETIDFCDHECLGRHQRKIGPHCHMCRGNVPFNALGKYSVRFGFYVKQFCCASCLNEFKKGLKTCSCCQRDISGERQAFLASVGQSDQFKDFCSQICIRRYEAMTSSKKILRNSLCGVCNHDKPVRVELALDEREYTFCSNPCFSAFKFVNNIVADQCGMCSKYFERKSLDSYTIYIKKRAKVFCSQTCFNVFMVINRYIVSCHRCKVKKYNFDMIVRQEDGQDEVVCSLNCLSQQYNNTASSVSDTSMVKCDFCSLQTTSAQYQLSMSDDSLRFFCSYQCVMQFQGQFGRTAVTTMDPADKEVGTPSSNLVKMSKSNGGPFPIGIPKRIKSNVPMPQPLSSSSECSVKKMSNTGTNVTTETTLAETGTASAASSMELRRTRTRKRKLDSPSLSPVSPSSSYANSGNAGGGTSTSTRGRPRRNTNVSVVKRSPSPSPTRGHSKRGQSMAGVVDVSLNGGTKIIMVPPYPIPVRNVQTNCRPQTSTVGTQSRPQTVSVGVQTEEDYTRKVLIPVPVPLYVPQPMYMYSLPFPVPLPIPLPIPVPIFIPTTRNSAEGIMKEIKKIQDQMPADPYEAELLMMAEMVAEEKQESDSTSDDEVKHDPKAAGTLQYNSEHVQGLGVGSTTAYGGEDVLQMALKMATGDYEQTPAHNVDLESAMATNTINSGTPADLLTPSEDGLSQLTEESDMHLMDPGNAAGAMRKRTITSTAADHNGRLANKRPRMLCPEISVPGQPVASPVVQMTEKPDANMCLKYTFGVNAWKQWVMTKNIDIEKSSFRRRPFKTELLQMTADELNYTLCLFVKEVRKPNGSEYAPDTIYYLVLGIQQYLYENGRIDNIFTDPYYEPFTNCLDEVAQKFSILYNDSQYIVTRVEEEHLWECKQLGAHSPHVLLSTLMFFNTKHFNLTTVEEHMQLSFSHIMKHWKRNVQNNKTAGTRNVLLRFYPPQTGLEVNSRKKKVYEQLENEENPLRCPVRLYEFYLSKCPESVKTRNDVFYLQPERSCVPDSPVWYSTQQLSQESLQKMLHRVKMVKEINIALLSS